MDDAALKDEVNVRFSAAHLLQALEEERRDAAAATPAPTGDDLDALLARIDNLHAQVDAATEERRAAAARQASLQSEMRDSDAARTAAVAELAALRDARDDAAHAHERELAEFRRRLKENTDRKRAAEVSARAKLRAYETDAAESAAVAAETARKVAASHARKMSGLEESARQAAVRAAAEHATNQATLTEMAADLATSQAWIASLQEQAETSACARAEASEAHSMALDALHSAHKEHLAGTSHRLKKDAAVALEHHAASLQSEHDAVLEGAMRKAKAESDAVKDEWNRERRDTHLEHTRELDRMHEGIAQLHSELVATEASLAQETSQVKALRESLSETATHEATARDTLEAFTEQYTAWRRKQSDDVAELRALHLERETALETAIAQADKDSTAFQTALEASADATVRQLKQEKEDACADLKYAHAQELKCNAALTEEAHQALQRVANDMLQLQTITHAGTRAQTLLTQQLVRSNHNIAAHTAAIKIQTSMRKMFSRRHLWRATKELREYMQSQKDSAKVEMQSQKEALEALAHRNLRKAEQHHQDQLSKAKAGHAVEKTEQIDAHNAALKECQRMASENHKQHERELLVQQQTINEWRLRVKNNATAHALALEEGQEEALTKVAAAVAKVERTMAERETQWTEAHSAMVEAQRLALAAQINTLETDRERLAGQLAEAHKANKHLAAETAARYAVAMDSLQATHTAAMAEQALRARSAHMLEMDRALALCADREAEYTREREKDAAEAKAAAVSAELKTARMETEAEQHLLELETTTRESTARLQERMAQAHQDQLQSHKESMDAEIEAARAEAAAFVQEAEARLIEARTLADSEVAQRSLVEKRLKREIAWAEARKISWDEMLRSRDDARNKERNEWREQREKFATERDRWQQTSKDEVTRRETIETQLGKTTDALHRVARQLEAEQREKAEVVASRAKEISRWRDDLAHAQSSEAAHTKAMHAKVTLLQDSLASMEVKVSQERTASKLKIRSLARQLENATLDLSCLGQVGIGEDAGEKRKKKKKKEEEQDAARMPDPQIAPPVLESSLTPLVLPMHTIDDALDLDDVQQLMHQRQRHMLMQSQMLAERRTHAFLLEKAERSRQSLEESIRKMTDEIQQKSLDVAKVREACSIQVEQLRSTFTSAIQDIVHDRDGAVERLLGVEREELVTLRAQAKVREEELLKSAAQIKAVRHDAAADRSRHERQRKQFGQRMELMHNTLVELTEAFHVANRMYTERDAERGKVMNHALEQLSLLPDREALLSLSPAKVREELAAVKGLLTPEPEKASGRLWL